MKTIWKFRMPRTQQIEMPKGATVLSAGQQDDQIMIWAEVDDNTTETEIRYFAVIRTGWDIDFHGRKFINTVFLDSGLAFHVYGTEV